MIIMIIVIIILFILGAFLFYITSKIKNIKSRLDECNNYLNDLYKKVSSKYLTITDKVTIDNEITSESFDKFIHEVKEKEDFSNKKFKKFQEDLNEIKSDEETIISLKKYYNKYVEKYNNELNKKFIKYWYKLLKFKNIEKFKIEKNVSLEILKD